jgi:hypothetical protein
VHVCKAHKVFGQYILPAVPAAKIEGAFGPSASNSWYPHYFNTKENLNYVATIPEITYYCADQMGVAERTEFLEWYEGQKFEHVDNKRLLESYC